MKVDNYVSASNFIEDIEQEVGESIIFKFPCKVLLNLIEIVIMNIERHIYLRHSANTGL